MSEHPTAPDDGQPQTPDETRSALGAVVLHHTVTAVMLVLILAIGVWAYLTFRNTSFFQAPDEQADTRTETYLLEAQLQRVEFALGVYFRLQERYPSDLSQLVDRGLLRESDLYYPSGRDRLVYSRTAGGYELDLATP